MINSSFLIFLLFFLPISLSTSQQVIPVKDPKNPIFSFGSCIDLYGNQNSRIFQYIAQQTADVWTWLGDAVYLPYQAEDANYIVKMLNFVKYDPLYSKIRQQTPIIGTWDDHDYGQNDGDKLYVHKERNKQLFLDFLDEPKTSPRRTRDGVYESYYLGEEKRVKIILLDVRYNRDPRFSGGQDMLGEQQWKWLENELKESSADFTLIGSGSQVLPDDRLFTETWYGGSRKRLLELIRKVKISGVLLLSGDVHFAEVLKYPCPERLGYENFYEFTSSGLTQYPPVPQAKQLLDEMFPYTFNEPKERYFTRNFGMIKFSFEGKEPKAVLEIKDEKGRKIMEKEIYASEMKFREEKVDLDRKCVVDESGYWRFGKKLWGEISKGNFFVVKYPIVNGRHLLRLLGVGIKHAVTLGVFGATVLIGILIVKVVKRKRLMKEKNE